MSRMSEISKELIESNQDQLGQDLKSIEWDIQRAKGELRSALENEDIDEVKKIIEKALDIIEIGNGEGV